MKTDYDLAIVGSGFGGSLLAMIACRLGLSVLLLEKGSHPRFAIGESTSPLANLLLEQIARRYDLPRLLPLTSYGPWQRAYPHIACGLKRGFTFFSHDAGQPRSLDPTHRNQLLVAASPQDEVADTHWLRADVDAFLVQEAIAAGAEYFDHVTLNPPEWPSDGAAVLIAERRGQRFTTRARLVVDATGPRGFLAKSLGLPEGNFPDYPPTQALYSHFAGVRRCDMTPVYQNPDTPPYPMDDAALHHVFEGGWMWALRFGNGITSSGIAVTERLAEELNLAEGEAAWHRLLARYPSVGEQFAEAEATRPFTHAPRLSYRASAAAGPGWVMLPSAAAFVDPLFSTGIPLTLLGIERLGQILEEAWGTKQWEARLREYSRETLAEADSTADFLGACYAAMPCFPIFAALSQFYFAAASYGEMARRLGKPHLVRRFLASSHPEFGRSMRRCTAWVRRHGAQATREDIRGFELEVAQAISCCNIAGLSDPRKRNWYGVDFQDVIEGAAKLEMTPAEIQAILQTAPGRSRLLPSRHDFDKTAGVWGEGGTETSIRPAQICVVP